MIRYKNIHRYVKAKLKRLIREYSVDGFAPHDEYHVFIPISKQEKVEIYSTVFLSNEDKFSEDIKWIHILDVKKFYEKYKDLYE